MEGPGILFYYGAALTSSSAAANPFVVEEDLQRVLGEQDDILFERKGRTYVFVV